MKLATFLVSGPTGAQRRLGGLQNDRIVDLTSAYATYLAQRTDEPTPRELAHLRTPPDLIGWLRGQPRSFLAQHLVACASDNETLQPRDILGTRTVSHSCSVDLHKWPQVGQTVRFDVQGIGTLEHTIVKGEHDVDYVRNGIDGLLQAPREVAAV